MAKHNGIIPIKGTVGNMTFLDTRDGLIVRKKSNFDGNRIASDARFVRTRENMAEFSRAGNAGKVLRQALAAIIDKASDRRVTSRSPSPFFTLLRGLVAMAFTPMAMPAIGAASRMQP